MEMPRKPANVYIRETRARAMEWLGKMDCMESSLECADMSAGKKEELQRRVHWIRRGLDVLSDEERKILLWIADGCSIDEMCEMTSREKSSLYNVRNRAMNRFAIALFGRAR